MPTYTATVDPGELIQHTQREVKIEAATDQEANDKLRFMVGTRWVEVGWWIIPEQEEFDEVDGVQRPWAT